jgi:hypothetical protein
VILMKNSKFEAFSLEAEQSVLGGLILSPENFSEVANILTEIDFHDKRHQTLFKTIRSIVDQGESPDVILIADNLLKQSQLDAIGGGEYLGFLSTNIPSAANILGYARIVKRKSLERQAVALMEQAIWSNDPLKHLENIASLQKESLVCALDKFKGFGKRIDDLGEDKPTEWLVDGLIAKSSRTLLVAKPKVGKTIFSLDLALGIADGGLAVSEYNCAKGDVLYLALEGGEDRLKSTIRRLINAHRMPLPDSFYYETECPDVDNGGQDAIESWCLRVANPVLVVIDMLQNFRSTDIKKGQSLYDADYQATEPLKALVEKYGVSFLINSSLQ